MATRDIAPQRWRGMTAKALVAFSCVLVLVGVFAVWVNRQALNTDNWTKTSSKLLEQPQVRSAVADRLTDAVFASVDVDQALRTALPERAQALASPIANAFRTQVRRTAVTMLERPDAQARWEQANRIAHRQLLAVIDGGGSTVSTNNGVVVVDADRLLDQLQQEIGLGGRLRKALPAGATQVTVFESDQLRTAQTAVRVLRPLPVILLLAAVALLAVAIAIAPRWRRQAVRAFGCGIVAVGLATLAIRSVAGSAFVSSLASTEAARPLVETVWSIATEMLPELAVAVIAYGIVIVLAAWLGGPTRPAVAVRSVIAPYLREPAIAYVALAVAVAGLVWWAPTPAWRDVAMTVILVGLLAAGVEALRRQVIREFPDRTLEEATRHHRERWARLAAATRRRGARLRDSGAAVIATSRDATVARFASTEDQRLTQLERLGQLREAGILDDDELRAEKARILNGAAAGGDGIGTS
jgi:predicted nucleic acid-binding protein